MCVRLASRPFDWRLCFCYFFLFIFCSFFSLSSNDTFHDFHFAFDFWGRKCSYFSCICLEMNADVAENKVKTIDIDIVFISFIFLFLKNDRILIMIADSYSVNEIRMDRYNWDFQLQRIKLMEEKNHSNGHRFCLFFPLSLQLIGGKQLKMMKLFY